jgi:hypothetical protein
MADNFMIEVVTIHRSQMVLKMLSLYTYISFAINYFVKKLKNNNPSCTYNTPDYNGPWMEWDFMG